MITATFSGQNIDNANAVVVLFIMDGCPACKEFAPLFRRVAAPYQKQGLVVLIYDAASKDARVQAFADRIGVRYTPTLAVLKRGGGIIKEEGALPEHVLRHMLDTALYYA